MTSSIETAAWIWTLDKFPSVTTIAQSQPKAQRASRGILGTGIQARLAMWKTGYPIYKETLGHIRIRLPKSTTPGSAENAANPNDACSFHELRLALVLIALVISNSLTASAFSFTSSVLSVAMKNKVNYFKIYVVAC